MVMMILASVGTLFGYAEESTEEASAEPQAPPIEVTEDGYIDSERLKQWVKTIWRQMAGISRSAVWPSAYGNLGRMKAGSIIPTNGCTG